MLAHRAEQAPTFAERERAASETELREVLAEVRSRPDDRVSHRRQRIDPRRIGDPERATAASDQLAHVGDESGRVGADSGQRTASAQQNSLRVGVRDGTGQQQHAGIVAP